MIHSASISDRSRDSDHALQLYTNATLYPCSDQGVIQEGTLVILNQKILWVGEAQSADDELEHLLREAQTEGVITSAQELINSMEVIDCTGEHLCPGFVDAHVHMGLYPEGFIGEPKDLNELTQPLTPQLRAIDGIWPEDVAFQKARRGGVTTVCVLPGSANVIGGVGVILKTYGIDVEEMCVKEPACLKIAFGYNVKYNHGKKGRAPLTRMAIVDMLRTSFDETLQYEEQRLLKEETPVDRAKEMILLALKREIPVRAHASRSDDILSALRIARDYGLKMVIEHGYEANRVIPQIQRQQASDVYGPAFRTCGHSEDLHFDFAHAQELLTADIPVAQMTDHPIVPIQYLSIQAGLCVRAGLDSYEALKLITAYPADILECSDVGRLSAGKDADFIRMSGPPLEISSSVLATYIQGQRVDHL